MSSGKEYTVNTEMDIPELIAHMSEFDVYRIKEDVYIFPLAVESLDYIVEEG